MSIKGYSEPVINPEDIDRVVNVLKDSKFLTQGPVVRELSNTITADVEASAVALTNSATSALYAVFKTFYSDAIVWIAANTFVATANAALLAGCRVSLIDVGAESGVICQDSVIKLLESTREESLPKAIVYVDIAGHPVRVSSLGVVCHQLGIDLVDDASHAYGASTDMGPVGSSTNPARFTIFSFHAVKPFTSGEGGAISFKNFDDHAAVEEFLDHGINRGLSRSPSQPWMLASFKPGLNLRMTEIQAALLSSQLARAKTVQSLREEIAGYYVSNIDAHTWTVLEPNFGYRSAHHLFVVLSRNSHAHRLRTFESFRRAGFQCSVHYPPLSVHGGVASNLEKTSFNGRSHLRGAFKYYLRALSIPFGLHLDQGEIDSVLGLLERHG